MKHCFITLLIVTIIACCSIARAETINGTSQIANGACTNQPCLSNTCQCVTVHGTGFNAQLGVDYSSSLTTPDRSCFASDGLGMLHGESIDISGTFCVSSTEKFRLFSGSYAGLRHNGFTGGHIDLEADIVIGDDFNDGAEPTIIHLNGTARR